MRKMRVLSLIISLAACAALSLVGSDAAAINKKDLLVGHSVETVADTEKMFKKLVNTGVKMALPFLMSTATEVKISGKCMTGLLMTMKGVMDIKEWAVKMVDALGKPSAGMLEGTATAMGDYDECLDIVVPRRMRPVPTPPFQPHQIAFKGQYCVLQIHLPEAIKKAAMDYQAGNRTNSALANSKTFLKSLLKLAPRADIAGMRFGVCIPSVCSKRDLQSIIDEISSMVKFSASTLRCEIKEPITVSTEQILVLCAVGFLIMLIIGSTSAEVYVSLQEGVTVDDLYLEKKGLSFKCLLAFSIKQNVQKLFSLIPSHSPRISSIRGLKLALVILYVSVWTMANPSDFHFFKYRSAFNFFRYFEEFWFSLFANAAAGVDTVFLIAGLQVTYRLWSKAGKGAVKISISKFILKWYLRITLSQLIVIGLMMCLPILGRGPIWEDTAAPVIENCKQTWWMNVLAVNNFFSSDKTCLPHTWLLCCLMHLLILAPVVLFILSKSTRLGIFVSIMLTLGSCTAIAIVTLMNDLPPTPSVYLMSYINIKALWEKVFIQAYDHIGSFCIGIMLGFFFNRYETISLRRITVIVGWGSALTCLGSVLCGLYGYRHGEIMAMSVSAVYASMHRIAWSFGIAWIIFACGYGYAGFVNSFLSWKLLIPFERLANLIYLLHPLILYLHEGQLREKMYMGHLDQAMYATACIVFTIAISAVCYVSCVAPFLFFEKQMWYYNSYSENNTAENQLAKIREGLSINIDSCKEKFQYIRNSVRIHEKEKSILKT